jgi:hypothetical protein
MFNRDQFENYDEWKSTPPPGWDEVDDLDEFDEDSRADDLRDADYDSWLDDWNDNGY